ncbi:MAG: 3-dehydroquinate synthase [Candidatus Amulumruptor sp.]
MSQQLIFTDSPALELDRVVGDIDPTGRIFILTDDHTASLVLPRLSEESYIARQAQVITIPSGDVNKSLDSLAHIWDCLVDGGATRKSLMINLGGGMVTDIGGFAASTFKRGIRFVNMPTTLLAAVDASVGGKTGINFHGLKNEIGVFSQADAVIISTTYFDTLPVEELLSGYGEMLKHGLLESLDSFNKLMAYDVTARDMKALLPILEENVDVKRRVVEEDPTERGLRKALNLGHTPAHAFESWAMHRQQPIPHGYAVAFGLLVDLILSHMLYGFDSAVLQQYAATLRELYGTLPITCNDYDALIDYMHHDKKNVSGTDINFSLLEAPGKVHLDSIVPEDKIRQALDIFRDLVQ